MTTATTLYPSAWIFPAPGPDRLPVGALLPVVMQPSPNPRDCGNCGGHETVFAYKVTDKKWGNVRFIRGELYHLTLISAPCPVCQGNQRADWLLGACGLQGLFLDGKPMIGIRLADVAPGPGQDEAFAAAWGLLAELPQPKTWALFSGAFGRGKTHILAGLVNGCRLADVYAEYTRAELVLAALRDTYDKGATARTSDVIAHYTSLPALALDELDRIQWTEWSCSQLFSILETRYTLGRATWFGSNLGPSALERLDPTAAALVSRISSGVVAALTGDDLRPAGGDPSAIRTNGLPTRFTE